MPELEESGIERVPGLECHYSSELVTKLVQSLKSQLVTDGQMDAAALHSSGPTADYPEPNPTAWEDVYDIQGTLLDPDKVKAGREEEIQWILKQDLFHYVPEAECYERQGKPYTLKWVDKNKGDKVQSRIVVRKIQRAKTEEEKLDDGANRQARKPFGACCVRRLESTRLRRVCARRVRQTARASHAEKAFLGEAQQDDVRDTRRLDHVAKDLGRPLAREQL
eukprot:2216652-Amphidinium_carterae.1